jgi:hypothetical protein
MLDEDDRDADGGKLAQQQARQLAPMSDQNGGAQSSTVCRMQ